MTKDKQKKIGQKIYEAVCYRLVAYMGNTEMANEWGYLPGTLGYKGKCITGKAYRRYPSNWI